MTVTARAHGKVNLHLGVGDAREDGYHELFTIFQSLSFHDDVTLTAADEMSLKVTGRFTAGVPADGTNLAWRAVEAVAKQKGSPARVAITIDKNIPVAGGMAGGSADAAAALVAANELIDGPVLPRDALLALAADLGSDVPFVLQGGTKIGQGRGEELTDVLVRGEYSWVLVFSRQGLSTPKVFGELDRLRAHGKVAPPQLEADELLSALGEGSADAVAQHLHNDLGAAAVSLQPTLQKVMRDGEEAGALRAVISGSGPTVALLCQDAEAVADEMVALGYFALPATGPVSGAHLL